MRLAFAPIVLLGLSAFTFGQVDEMCREFGAVPSMDSPFAHVPYIFGRVTVTGLEPGAKPPKVTVTLADGQQSRNPVTVGARGNYCFRRSGSSGGTLIVEVGGMEMARRSLPAMGSAQQREDFEIHVDGGRTQTQPAVVSARFNHPRNEKTVDLYRKAAEAHGEKDVGATIKYLKDITAVDPLDFVAWGQLGSLYFEKGSFDEADAAFRRSLELKPEYTAVWINVGKMRVAQKGLEAAIEIFKHAAELEPKNAKIFRLLGETYLQAKQGTLGVDALNQALKLDPVGMAECHLLIARLYELAGAKPLAAREYKLFLEKVPNYAEKKKLEKYIKDHPDQ